MNNAHKQLIKEQVSLLNIDAPDYPGKLMMRVLLIAGCAKHNNSLVNILHSEQHEVVQQVGLIGSETIIDDDFDLVLLDGALTAGITRDNLLNAPALGKRPQILLFNSTDQLLDTTFCRLLNIRCYPKPLTAAQLLHELAFQEIRHYTATDTITITAADLHLNVYKKTVTRSGKLIKLTRMEFLLLKFLLLQKNRLVLRNSIIQKLWGVITVQRQKSLNSCIALLRKKIDTGYAQQLLHTISGQGYILREE